MTITEFIAAPLADPIVYAQVSEGNYLTAESGGQYESIATFGLFTCKGIALHNPDSGRGLLAHVNGRPFETGKLSTIVDKFGEDLTAANISIVETVVSDNPSTWPGVDAIADFFLQYNPKSLRVDRNIEGRIVRGIALNTQTGTVHEVDRHSQAVKQSRQVLKLSLPLHVDQQ